MRAPIRPALVLTLLALTATGLAGCGRKGSLEVPTASTTPAPSATSAQTTTDPKAVSTPGGTTIVPSKEPSILDAIL